eukprot:CAMPEP_0201569802 /NCGR_PEP_ID=MMETSP0190_2-20130828/11704_1 /ASSEMBLY_ACC=CAM_ASM_000263 /TAXON_ID=37353 /ORGANISM="Rosalina sp." /LENGTH=150 /DNA_ID=CAMNT_0047992567 /DNA_START=23 /DNA_END=475 /DNA_ORIENTATION=+
MSINKNEILLYGALTKHQKGGTGSTLAAYVQAVGKEFGENYSVMTYTGYGRYNGWTNDAYIKEGDRWITIKKTTNTAFDEYAIKQYMDIEFGWAKIDDISKFQQSVYAKINAKFSGSWAVDVITNPKQYSAKIYGAVWIKDGVHCQIFRS